MNNTKKYLVRSDRAGVFYGEIKSRTGSEVTMTNVRRIWYWDGAVTLSQLAIDGTSRPKKCKFTCYVPETIILDVVEILTCTDKAVRSIERVPEWKINSIPDIKTALLVSTNGFEIKAVEYTDIEAAKIAMQEAYVAHDCNTAGDEWDLQSSINEKDAILYDRGENVFVWTILRI